MLIHQNEREGSESWFLLIDQHWGRGSLVIKFGPDVNHGITLSGFAAFLALEMKYNWDLDITSSLTKTLSLWSRVPRICS